MRRTISLVLAALSLSLFTGAADARLPEGPSAGGISSDNVEFIKHVPGGFNAVGGRKVGDYWYVNDQHKIMVFDVSDPLNPTMTGFIPMPQEYMYSREDLDTNGTIMVVPNTVSARQTPDGSLPATTNVLFVISVEDKTNPQIIAELPGAAQHTFSCILDCKWAYGSGGNIVDLRNPAKPKLLEEKWTDSTNGGGGHDVTEVSPGIVLTSSSPINLLDARKDPTRPKVLAVGENIQLGAVQHSAIWPHRGKSDFLLMGSETNNKVRCTDVNGSFQTWDARSWQKTRTFKLIDKYQMANGTYVDGSPPANVWGCSSHWHENNPRYGLHGGLVAGAFFEHGVRFMDVSSKGQIEEVGYFMPHGGNTGAVYWITDRIAYTADYGRGIDIIKWNGKL